MANPAKVYRQWSHSDTERPAHGRMAAVAIGVSHAPPLPYLRGALGGAADFFRWSQALGYHSKLVTDEDSSGPVTALRLRTEIDELLDHGEGNIHRFLIYFAGHGIIREAEESLWLLSDWNAELRAVAIDWLRRRLLRYGIEQVAIFADACRTLPPDIEMADLAPDPLLGRGRGQRSSTMAIDKFVAAQDGARTYVIPGAVPDEDRCLFSGVLLEGLWGTKPSAFSTLQPDKVTSRSLGAYLQKEVPELAERYRVTLMPSVSPTFPEGDDVYFGVDSRITPPVFPPWPPPEVMLPVEPAADPGVSADDVHGRPDLLFHERDEVSVRRRWLRIRRRRELRLRRGESRAEGTLSSRPARPASEPDRMLPMSLEERLRLQTVDGRSELQCGFAVDGDTIRRIWAAGRVVAEGIGTLSWVRVRDEDNSILRSPTPILIELSTGAVSALTALPDFVGSLVVARRGVSGLIYRKYGADLLAGSATEEALSRLEQGGLRVEDTLDLAAELRQSKHADPVLGVICSYLFESIGDVESIRRMAYYYVRCDQPIPYDVALLAQLQGERRTDGLLWATVPAISSREPRTEREGRLEWLYSPTESVSGVVGGFWPWLRQGWAFLDDVNPESSALILPDIVEVADQVTSARFTTLSPTGGRHLANRFSLRSGLL